MHRNLCGGAWAVLGSNPKRQNGRSHRLRGCPSSGSSQAREKTASSRDLCRAREACVLGFHALSPKNKCFCALAEVLGVARHEIPAVPKVTGWHSVGFALCRHLLALLGPEMICQRLLGEEEQIVIPPHGYLKYNNALKGR